MADRQYPSLKSDHPQPGQPPGDRMRADYNPFSVQNDNAAESGKANYGQGYTPASYDPAIHGEFNSHKPNWTDSFPHSFTGWGPQTPDYGHDHPEGKFQASLHFDDDYLLWRAEQIRKLDEDYIAWRNERHARFNEDFNAWRSRHSAVGAPAADTSKPKS